MTLRHYLNKLISEEILAFETYKVLNTIFYRKNKFQKTLIELIDDISDDEYSDHAKKLIDYCRKMELPYPSCNLEYVKHASANSVKAFNIIPDTDDLVDLIEFAMELERDAIDSYNEALKIGIDSEEFDTEIIAILQHNLKDENDHYDKLLIAHSAAQENFNENI